MRLQVPLADVFNHKVSVVGDEYAVIEEEQTEDSSSEGDDAESEGVSECVPDRRRRRRQCSAQKPRNLGLLDNVRAPRLCQSSLSVSAGVPPELTAPLLYTAADSSLAVSC